MKFWKLSLKIGAFEIKLKFWILKTNSGNWEFENYSKMETLKIRFFYKKKNWEIKLWKWGFWKLNLEVKTNGKLHLDIKDE